MLITDLNITAVFGIGKINISSVVRIISPIIENDIYIIPEEGSNDIQLKN